MQASLEAKKSNVLTWSLLPVVVRYGKLLLDTDRSLSLPLSSSKSFSFLGSPNQGKGKQEGMEVMEPDGEIPVGSSTRSPYDPLDRNNETPHWDTHAYNRSVTVCKVTSSIFVFCFCEYCVFITPVVHGPSAMFLTSPFAKRLAKATGRQIIILRRITVTCACRQILWKPNFNKKKKKRVHLKSGNFLLDFLEVEDFTCLGVAMSVM